MTLRVDHNARGFWAASALGCGLLAACWPSPPMPPGPAAAPSPAGLQPGGVVARRSLAVGDYVGLSDLAYDPAGQLWSLPERQRALLPIRPDGPRPGLAGPPLAVVGVPEAYDTEAFAWVDHEVVALGTETNVPARQSDDIFFARRVDGQAVVFDRVRMPYSLWNMRAVTNRGIEGLCAAGNMLLATSETPVRLPDGRRAAPLGRYDMQRRQWHAFFLPLHSATGCISALTCRLADDGLSLRLWAIERHFGVSLLLSATLPVAASRGVVETAVWSDMGRSVEALPNLEGIAQPVLGGPVYIVTDNHYGRVTGPTEIFEVVPPLGG